LNLYHYAFQLICPKIHTTLIKIKAFILFILHHHLKLSYQQQPSILDQDEVAINVARKERLNCDPFFNFNPET